MKGETARPEPLRDLVTQRIRADGPMPFSAYMDLVLNHPALGYYSSRSRRSGGSGDFYTSVDLGSVFGELLARQLVEMAHLLGAGETPRSIDFVEAGAGDGRLAHDVLAAVASADPALYDRLRLTLVERSPTARGAHGATLGRHRARLAGSTEQAPAGITGVLWANELLDALPVHPVVMTASGLREIYVDLGAGEPPRLVERLGPLSPEAHAHIERWRIGLEPGWRAEVCPLAVRWMETAASRLERGFLMIIDYGHEATELYSATHSTGTLATYDHHVVQTAGGGRSTPWLAEPGQRDLTAHVDLTAVRETAEAQGLDTLAVVDQTYFLLGLAQGAVGNARSQDTLDAVKRRLALKTLLVPGGLGSTHKVMIFGKNVGSPSLMATAFSRRAT